MNEPSKEIEFYDTLSTQADGDKKLTDLIAGKKAAKDFLLKQLDLHEAQMRLEGASMAEIQTRFDEGVVSGKRRDDVFRFVRQGCVLRATANRRGKCE
jgi:hypothetical protein